MKASLGGLAAGVVIALLALAGCSGPAPAEGSGGSGTPTGTGSVSGTSVGAASPEALADAVEVFVDSVRVDTVSDERVVLLKQSKEGRVLPIWIGQFEAEAIAIPLNNVEVRRPLTHDLVGSVVSALGARVERVVINDFADGVFHARLVLEAADRHLEIDSRPSDAIAVALRVRAPIYVARFVMDRAGVEIDPESEEIDRKPQRVF